MKIPAAKIWLGSRQDSAKIPVLILQGQSSPWLVTAGTGVNVLRKPLNVLNSFNCFSDNIPYNIFKVFPQFCDHRKLLWSSKWKGLPVTLKNPQSDITVLKLINQSLQCPLIPVSNTWISFTPRFNFLGVY